jgi:hypothetical protein
LADVWGNTGDCERTGAQLKFRKMKETKRKYESRRHTYIKTNRCLTNEKVQENMYERICESRYGV